jgi:DNA-binding transcriptional LysR family regulator
MCEEARRRQTQGRNRLRDLTETGGGRFIGGTSDTPLEEIFMEVLAELKTRYIITYYPSDLERHGWREIEIKLENQKADIRARRGYYYRPSLPGQEP